jgi:hypothetical protein
LDFCANSFLLWPEACGLPRFFLPSRRPLWSPNRSGELARVAGKLGEANININHAYGGVEPSTNTPLLFFGVAEVDRAAQLLDQTASAAAGT